MNKKQNRVSKSRNNGRTRKDPRTDVKNSKQGSFREEDQVMDARGRDNDPNWYFTEPQIADQAASFAFDNYLEVDVPMAFNNSDNGADVSNVEQLFRAPSVLAIHCNPCPGDTSTIRTGINMAALKTYTRLSNANAKTTAYAPQDLTTLILAVGEVISILEHIRRAFGFAFTYSQRNRAMPSKLLDMMGFKSSDFLTNIAQHRLQYNSWITAVNKLPIMSNIAYLFKCASMYQKVYLDSTSNMGQLVFMKPYSTWVLDETSNEQGTVLKTTNVPQLATWDKWAKLVDTMIGGLFESSTFNFIYSDILNLSTKSGAQLLYLDYLKEDYSLVPEYNRNFLLQVHNISMAGMPLGVDQFSNASMPEGYTPDNDVLPSVNKNMVVYNPLFGRLTGNNVVEPIIDMDVPEANLIDRIEATRYMAVTKAVDTKDATTAKARKGIGLPDHYVVMLEISNERDNSTGTMFTAQTLEGTKTLSDAYSHLQLTQFDWAPLMYVKSAGEGRSAIIGDLNYWTTLDPDWFKRVNDLTFQALFEMR